MLFKNVCTDDDFVQALMAAVDHDPQEIRSWLLKRETWQGYGPAPALGKSAVLEDRSLEDPSSFCYMFFARTGFHQNKIENAKKDAGKIANK
jgi:hypothetical protein